MTDIILIIMVAAVLVLALAGLFRKGAADNSKIIETIKLLGEMISQNQKNTDEFQSKKFTEIDKNITEKQGEMNKAVLGSLSQMETRFKSFEQTNEQKLEAMREVMMKSLLAMQEDNSKKLEDMRKTVDEKLQKTLEEKMSESFKMVSERLEQVYKGLGEMQTLAVGVGDLKKVLSNVKTRGILGEIQLGAILKEILAPEQYEENVVTVPGSKNPVEFAVKMPNEGGFVYLPIDSKFPGDAFYDLQSAYEQGNPELIKSAVSVLLTRIKSFAKDIHDKYIEPPYTTDFAIMFLPFEGLYAEVVNQGMVEVLQNTYKVNIAGPSTMAALLNSLQMGFKTLAIQKRSVEVWTVLSSVKAEFDKFGAVLEATQTRLDQANKELDKLVGVRTRAIQKKLKDVQALDEPSEQPDTALEE
ncbi:MAG: DNA recombination protein RmuC [Clostridia bacterium]|nr:DNA recombination protein RmuC [Clostridia bacterium]